MKKEKTINKAGGIVACSQDGDVKILMLYRAKHDDWSFPKGHVESGESNEEAAIREVFEETGLQCKIVMNLPSLEYTNFREERVSLFLFLMEPNNFDLKEECVEDKLYWISIKEVAGKLKHENLKSYFSVIESSLIHQYI
jgi:8-oxo-dGTP diphosphatase